MRRRNPAKHTVLIRLPTNGNLEVFKASSPPEEEREDAPRVRWLDAARFASLSLLTSAATLNSSPRPNKTVDWL